jgi:hypothetical protein
MPFFAVLAMLAAVPAFLAGLLAFLAGLLAVLAMSRADQCRRLSACAVGGFLAGLGPSAGF